MRVWMLAACGSLAAVLLSVLGCGDPVPATPVGTTPVVLSFDSTVVPEFSASATVAGSGDRMHVEYVASMRNPDTRPRIATQAAPCTVLLRLYSESDSSGTAVHRDEAAPGGCKSSLRPDTLAAGATRTYRGYSTPFIITPPDRPQIAPLPPGRYLARVYISVRELPKAGWKSQRD